MTLILLYLSNRSNFNFDIKMQKFSYRIYTNTIFCIVQCTIADFLSIWICLSLVITRRNRIKKAGAKSDKETWLNWNIQRFASCLIPLHLCNCLQQTTRNFLFSVKHLCRPHILSSIFLYIRPSINQDNSTFHGTNFTNSCSRYENCEFYTQEVLNIYLY
jgi:hypothetical protein